MQSIEKMTCSAGFLFDPYLKPVLGPGPLVPSSPFTYHKHSTPWIFSPYCKLELFKHSRAILWSRDPFDH